MNNIDLRLIKCSYIILVTLIATVSLTLLSCENNESDRTEESSYEKSIQDPVNSSTNEQNSSKEENIDNEKIADSDNEKSQIEIDKDYYSEAFYLESDINSLLNKIDDDFIGLVSDEDYSNIPNEMIIEMADSMVKENFDSYILGRGLNSEINEDYQVVLENIDFKGLTGYNDKLHDLDNYTDIYKVDLDSDSKEEFIFFTPMKTGGLDFEAALFIKQLNDSYKIVDMLTFSFHEDIILIKDNDEIYLIVQTDGYIYSTFGTVFLSKISNNEQLMNSDYSIRKKIFDLDYVSLNLNNVGVNLEILFSDERNEVTLDVLQYINNISYDLMNTPRFFYGDEIPTHDEYLKNVSYFESDTNSYLTELVCKLDINNDGIDELIIKNRERSKNLNVEYFLIQEDNQVTGLDVAFKYPVQYQLTQQWFKEFNNQIYAFNLYSESNNNILVCSIIKGDKEQFVASALLNYRRNIVVYTNNNAITNLREMSPYVSRNYEIVNDDHKRNDSKDKEIALEVNSQLDKLLGNVLSAELQTAISTGNIAEYLNKYLIQDKINDEKFLGIFSRYKMNMTENDSKNNIAMIAIQEIESGHSNHNIFINDILYLDINKDGIKELVLNYELPGTGHHRGSIVLVLRDNEWEYISLDRSIKSAISFDNKMYIITPEYNYNLKTLVGITLSDFDIDMNISDISFIAEYYDFGLELRYSNPDYENTEVVEYVNNVATEVIEKTYKMMHEEGYFPYYDVFVDDGEPLSKSELARLSSSTFFFDYYDTKINHNLYKLDLNNDGTNEYVELIQRIGDNHPAYIEMEEYYVVDNRLYHGDFLTHMNLQIWFKRIGNKTYTFTLSFDYETKKYILMVLDIQGEKVNIVGEYFVSPNAAKIIN